MGGADLELIDRLTTHQVYMLRVSAGYQREALRILEDLERYLVGRLTASALTSWSRQRLLDMLAETRSAIAQAHSEIRRAVPLADVAALEARYSARALREAITIGVSVGVPSEARLRALVGDLLIQGAPSSEWWSRQAGDTAFRFASAVRQGVAAGETNAQIVQRIRGTPTLPGVMEVSRRNAEALVRTSVQTVAQATRAETWRANADLLEGVRWIATLDSRTTVQCAARDGLVWDLDGKPQGHSVPFQEPPIHWNCRSVTTPVVRPLPGMPEFRAGQRAAAGGPVQGGTTFDDWLARRSAAEQDEILGKGRAQLYRQNRLTLQQLLDQRGRPLTLEQLRQRYED